MDHGELTHGMALGGHILLGNYEIVRADGLMPVINFYPVQAHCTGGMEPVVEPCPKQCLRYWWNVAS